MTRKIEFILDAKESTLPGNFTVYRAIPRRELRRVGGFVFLDHFDSENVTPENFDVPPHPHIGLQTVTYLFEGEILHTDSLGFQQIIEPGAINWMTAGKGITHSEQVLKKLPRMHGIQSWIGLPHEFRRTEPAFDHYDATQIPQIQLENCKIRVIAGNLDDKLSPIKTFQPLTYFDVEVGKSSEISLEVNPQHELAVYVCSGEIEIESSVVNKFQLAKLSDNNNVFSFSSQTGARFILFGGESLPDPTVIYWNFVTDSVGEAKQALLDWEAGNFPHVGKYVKFNNNLRRDDDDKEKMKFL